MLSYDMQLYKYNLSFCSKAKTAVKIKIIKLYHNSLFNAGDKTSKIAIVKDVNEIKNIMDII